MKSDTKIQVSSGIYERYYVFTALLYRISTTPRGVTGGAPSSTSKRAIVPLGVVAYSLRLDAYPRDYYFGRLRVYVGRAVVAPGRGSAMHAYVSFPRFI